MSSLPLPSLVISFILRDIYWENCCLQILRNTEALNSYQGLSALGNFFLFLHREHIMLLNRERVNKGTGGMNSLPLSPLVISFILRDIYWENCCLQILRNTEALNSYPGLSALGKFFFVCIKFDKGGNSVAKTF